FAHTLQTLSGRKVLFDASAELHKVSLDAFNMERDADDCRLAVQIEHHHPWQADRRIQAFLACSWAAFAFRSAAAALVEDDDGKGIEASVRSQYDALTERNQMGTRAGRAMSSDESTQVVSILRAYTWLGQLAAGPKAISMIGSQM